MNWFFIALLAQFILGTSAVFDKLLLKKSFPNPIGYTFWLGVFGLTAILLLPFGFAFISWYVLLIALLAGSVFMAGMLCFFQALSYGEAAGAAVSISSLSPVATLVLGSFLLGTTLAVHEMISFMLLVSGSVLLVLLEQKHVRLRAFFFVLVAAGFLGLSNILSKFVFEESNFIMGFFWMKVGGALFVLLFLLYPRWRFSIFAQAKQSQPQHRMAYIMNRAYAGIGSALIYYAISLGSPPLVDALQSVRFLIIFIAGWLILHVKTHWKVVAKEFGAFTIISLAVIVLGVGDYLRTNVPDPDRPIEWGVTFSQKFAMLFDFGSLGIPDAKLGWQDNYDTILDDLGARHLRLIAYWDLIEPEEGAFDFSGLDYQMRRAEEVGADVILVVGKKVPRWPECHEPLWAQNLESRIKNQELLGFVSEVIKRYKDSSALRYWQVENEPFLAFGEGECALSGRELLETEIALVKKLDPGTPVLITDSGELGLWFRAAKRGDVFGTTMYRRVHNDRFGNFEYPLGPEFFRIKEKLARLLIGDFQKDFIVIELGMEPWLKRQPYETTPEEQFKVFDFAFFQDSIQYAKATGFDEYYLWGAEWWYWLKVRHNNPQFWHEARKLMRN